MQALSCRRRAPFLRQGGGLAIAGGLANVQLTNCNIYSNKADYVNTCARASERASKPKNTRTVLVGALSLNLFRMRAPFLRQGGGLFIDEDGNVVLTNCNIYSNKATGVSTRPKPRARC